MKTQMKRKDDTIAEQAAKIAKLEALLATLN